MNQKKKTFNYGIVVVVLICLGVFMPNYAQYQISAFGAQLSESLGLSTSQFAQIATAPMIPGIFLSLISGLLVDRFGVKKVIGIAICITSLSIVLRIFCGSFTPLYLCMMFSGVGVTFLNSNGAKVFGQWFSPAKASVMMGFFLAFANLGISLSTGTASMYPSMRGAFIGASVIAVIAAAGWLVFMKDRPDGEHIEEEVHEKVSIVDGLKVCLKNKHIWIAALCQLLSVGCITSCSNFMPQALQTRGIAAGTAGIITMGLTLGALLSNFISPMILNKVGKFKLMMVIYGVLTALGVAFGWRLGTNPVIIFIALFIAGFGSNGFSPLIMALPVQLDGIGTKYGGTAGGMLATIQLGGSVILPTYVIAPIAGSNYVLMFLLFGFMMLLFSVFGQFLPIRNGK